MSSSASDPVAAVRAFNRFYTRRIGLLREGLLDSPFSLTEVRVMYELATRPGSSASELAREMGLDPGYLSRVLHRLRRRGLVERRGSQEDGRRFLLFLSEAGRQAYGELDAASSRQVEAMLEPLGLEESRRLMEAMETIRRVLDPPPPSPTPWILRPPGAGDLGWIVHRHGVLYRREYGWDERFEALVAGIVAEFVRDFDPRRDRGWIAEREGRNVGSVLLVHHPERPGVARLRVLLVEPEARGLGIGRRLVQECTRFARDAGYHSITLWTNSMLHAARRIYQGEGYRLVHEAPHDLFPPEHPGQTWELELRDGVPAGQVG